jgi:C-terminal processing protease CtpA/Prc
MLPPQPASAAETLTFPVAENPELFSVQKTLVEAWSILTETYVDPTFNHLDWQQELSSKLNSIAYAPSKDVAAEQIATMVSDLGDPFTRWVSPKDYADFRVSSDGELKGGVGLLIAQDPASGRLLVLAPIQGSPADRAGIKPGDEVLKVNGTSTEGMDSEKAASVLRGEQGSSVMVEVARRKESTSNSAVIMPISSPPARIETPSGTIEAIPGVPGPYPADTKGVKIEHKQFRLRRERVELSPVFATAMHYDDHNFGYVRLVNFSQHAAHDMEKAIEQLKKDGAEAFILDLRNNPGGLVTASLDVASLWLNAETHPTIFSIQDRGAEEEKEIDGGGAIAAAAAAGALPSAARVQEIVLSGGEAATDLPMVVLVNRQSASASEILAGALRDNHRAEVIGDRTFGKGKIQSVFELGDGSAVFVTIAKYRTPAGTDIDKVGVVPDRACTSVFRGGPKSVPGIPVGPGADKQVVDELETDACVLTAESVLDARVDDVGYSQRNSTSGSVNHQPSAQVPSV